MTHHIAPRSAQGGVVLITSMILLVVMTLFAVTAVRMMSQQERMVAYSYDRSLAFQAAEAALRLAEASVEAGKPEPLPADPCKKFNVTATVDVQVCPAPASTTTRWTDAAFAGWADSTAVGTGTLAVTPKYFVEYMGNTFPCKPDPMVPANCKRYRVTAKAGGAGRAAAMVQSVYATD